MKKIQVLIEAKLSSITDLISKALTDDKISEEEYSVILAELDKFRQLKEQIRRTYKTSFDSNIDKIPSHLKKKLNKKLLNVKLR